MPQKNNYSLLTIVIFLCLKGLEQTEQKNATYGSIFPAAALYILLTHMGKQGGMSDTKRKKCFVSDKQLIKKRK